MVQNSVEICGAVWLFPHCGLTSSCGAVDVHLICAADTAIPKPVYIDTAVRVSAHCFIRVDRLPTAS